MANEMMRKLYRSLSLIIFANIGGYLFFKTTLLLLITFIPMYPILIWYLSGYLAIILNISSAINAPILYLNRHINFNYKTKILF